MKYFILCAWALIFSATLIAQTRGTIAGKIVSKTEKAAQGATVSLYRVGDSTALKRTIANNEGSYRFESVTDGKYIITVTAVGHQKGVSKTIEMTTSGQAMAQVPPIPLVPLNANMTGVTVITKRPLIEQKVGVGDSVHQL